MVDLEYTEKAIYEVLHTVPDPEVPVISVVDLGVVRRVSIDNQAVLVEICPTYSGCPALDVIATDIKTALMSAGYFQVKVEYVLDEPWTTEWMTDNGKKQMKAFGIAPPVRYLDSSSLNIEAQTIACPQCGSEFTSIISEFGSTACKALMKCNSCLEPFDYFKCH